MYANFYLGRYNLWLVFLSFIIAVVASYTAFEIIIRVASSRKHERLFWLSSGALTLGIGMWSMHFTGLLALGIAFPLAYDARPVLLSLIVAMTLSFIALYFVRDATFQKRTVLLGGTTIGLGTAAMHFIGMEAIRRKVDIQYNPLIVALAIIVCISTSIIAILLLFHFRANQRTINGTFFQLASSLLMGGAMTGMHYVSLSAATLTLRPTQDIPNTTQLDTIAIGTAVGVSSLLILCITLILIVLERRVSTQTAEFESLFMYHPDAVFALDLSGNILSENSAATTMLGKSSLHTTFSSFISPAEHFSIGELLKHASGGSEPPHQAIAQHADGHALIVSVTSVPIISRRQIVGLYGIVRDITERTHIEQERERLIAILEATTDIIGTANPNGQVMYCNHAGRALIGWPSPEELSNVNFLEAYAPSIRQQMMETALPVAMRDGVWVGEGVLLAQDGREIPISQVILAHRGPNGEVAYLSNIARDITERKQAEAALERERAQLAQRVEERTAELRTANIELARSARLKDEFLASVSHELRTPLNAILGLAESLREGIYGPLTTEQAEALRGITESGHHLLALINDILELSKIEAGKVKLNYEPIMLEELCEASLRLIRQSALKKRLSVSWINDSVVTALNCDARRLKQALVNLLSNAVKFTPEGGSIGLEIVGDHINNLVHLTVWDNGIGIAPENMSRLFQPFVQLDSSLSRQYAGTGLGLALVERMVRLHNGMISVESEPNKGSRFKISLPWSPEQFLPENALSDRLLPKTHTLSFGSTPTIMLAEDNELNITTYVDYLTANGYHVVVARNGRDLLSNAHIVQPSLFLMDIQMPELDGLETIRCLRADKTLATTPIIALTALAMPGDETRCLEVGANIYLSKPVSLRTLRDTIAHQLEGAAR